MYEEIASNKRRSAALIAAFAALIAVIGWALGEVAGIGYVGLILASIVAVVAAWGSYRYSDRIVLSMSRARPADEKRDAYLVNTVEGLSIAAGLPVPDVYVLDDSAPNALATGRDPEHASIAVTTGLIEKLDRLELEGVVAHELAHVRNYDVRLMTIAAVLAGTMVLLAGFLRRSFLWGGRGRRRKAGPVAIVALAVAVLAAVLAPLAAAALRSAISRNREFLADAEAARLTRYPPGLAGALRKIAADDDRLQVANKATAPLYIHDPLVGGAGRIDRMLKTHPPVEERIRRLEAM